MSLFRTLSLSSIFLITIIAVIDPQLLMSKGPESGATRRSPLHRDHLILPQSAKVGQDLPTTTNLLLLLKGLPTVIHIPTKGNSALVV